MTPEDLVEIELIKRVKYAYARCLDLKRWDEIADLFTEWLKANCPDRAGRVLSLMRSTRGGKLYDAKWGERMVGEGPYVWIIGRRFEIAAERLGFNKDSVALRTDLFTPPVLSGQQLRLL